MSIPTDMPGPNETRLNLIDGIEYITLRADDFRTTMRGLTLADRQWADHVRRLADERDALRRALSDHHPLMAEEMFCDACTRVAPDGSDLAPAEGMSQPPTPPQPNPQPGPQPPTPPQPRPGQDDEDDKDKNRPR